MYVCISLPRLHHQLAKTIVNIVGSKLSQAYKTEAIHTCIYYLVNHILLWLALLCLMSNTISAFRWQQTGSRNRSEFMQINIESGLIHRYV